MEWYQLGERGRREGPALDRRRGTDGVPRGVLNELVDDVAGLLVSVVADEAIERVLLTLAELPLRGRLASPGARRPLLEPTPSLLWLKCLDNVCLECALPSGLAP